MNELQKLCAAILSLLTCGLAIYFLLCGWNTNDFQKMTFAVCLAIYSDVVWLPYKKTKE